MSHHSVEPAVSALAKELNSLGAISVRHSSCTPTELANAEMLGIVRRHTEMYDGSEVHLLLAGPNIQAYAGGKRRAPPVPGRRLEMACLAHHLRTSKFDRSKVLILPRRHAYVTYHPTNKDGSIMFAARLVAPAKRTLERTADDLFINADMSDVMGDAGNERGRILPPLAELVILVPPRQLAIVNRRLPNALPRGLVTVSELDVYALTGR